MSIFRFSVGSDAKSMAVPCVFAIGVVCWANCLISTENQAGGHTAPGIPTIKANKEENLKRLVVQHAQHTMNHWEPQYDLHHT